MFKRKKKRILLPILIVIWVITAALTIAAFASSKFATWYVDNLTQFRINTYARFSNLFSFSIGEVMIVAAIALVVITAVFLILLIFLHRKRGFRKAFAFLVKADVLIISLTLLLMTLNCTVLYKADTLKVYNQETGEEVQKRQYTKDELRILRNYIVDKCNEYSLLVDRGEDGYVTYSGDLQQTSQDALHSIADFYPRLSGFYPNVKMMFFSDLMCQSYMEGYYFPFSMEANCNNEMYILNYPESFCHELSHLHGYILEDEANYLSFLACTNSDDDFFVYSGYMKVLNYVVNAYYPYIATLSDEEKAQLSVSSDLVDKDNIFLLPGTWDKVEEKAVVSTETVKEASNTFTDSTLKLNGVEDGMASYDRVVELLLQYYDGVLY